MHQIALFPIPDCVAFPGTTFPLHVFEPRYRSMVCHCIETNTFMAVCHTKKKIRDSKPRQSIEESLKSNQATYLPFRVFSAGECELIETLPDGRMYINVHLKKRFKALEEVQTLPFSLWLCEEYRDEASEFDLSEAIQLKEKIIQRLSELTNDATAIKQRLQSEEWNDKVMSDFSFELFSLIRFSGNYLQNILEKKSVVERLRETLDVLNKVA